MIRTTRGHFFLSRYLSQVRLGSQQQPYDVTLS